MFDMSAHSNWDGEKLTRIVATGSGKALVRAAAYVRKVARNKVRRSKKKRSKPGQPPLAHTEAFKSSILFAVDSAKTTADIGPEKFGGTPKVMAMMGLSGGGSKRVNSSGQPLPNILEEGGAPIVGPEPYWWNGVRSVLGRPNGNDDQAITRFFKHLGYGPAYWGNSSVSVRRKASRSKAAHSFRVSLPSEQKPKGWTYKRYSRIKRKTVYLQNIAVNTIQQAVKVKNLVLKIFGKPNSSANYVAPRPLMGPSLAESETMIASFWRDSAK